MDLSPLEQILTVGAWVLVVGVFLYYRARPYTERRNRTPATRPSAGLEPEAGRGMERSRLAHGIAGGTRGRAAPGPACRDRTNMR